MMMDIAMAASEENSLTNFSPRKLLEEIYSSLCLHHGIVGIIGEPGRQIEAAILMRIESLWYTDDLSIIERAIFVHPDFRAAKGGRAAKLCDWAKRVANEMNLPLVIGILSSQRTAAKVKLYERQFGEAAGAYWIVGGRTGGHSVVKAASEGADVTPHAKLSA
jgi:hypothetical protein